MEVQLVFVDFENVEIHAQDVRQIDILDFQELEILKFLGELQHCKMWRCIPVISSWLRFLYQDMILLSLLLVCFPLLRMAKMFANRVDVAGDGCVAMKVLCDHCWFDVA